MSKGERRHFESTVLSLPRSFSLSLARCLHRTPALALLAVRELRPVMSFSGAEGVRRRDSLASTGSDSVDDLVFTRPRGASPATGYAYDFTTSIPDYDLSASSVDSEHGQLPAALPAAPSGQQQQQQAAPQVTASAAASNRSRARAFSFLSVHHQGGNPAGMATPGGLSSPFSGGAYDSALDDGHDDDDGDDSEADDIIGGLDRATGPSTVSGRDEYPLSRIGTNVSASASAPNRSVYRVRFQPLDGYELAGMAASAIAVLALTATALVVAIVG